MNYWQDRIIVQRELLYKKGIQEQNKQLIQYYQRSAKKTIDDISKLYDALIKESADGNIKVNDLYRYNRYFEIMNNMNTNLKQLGTKEIEIDSKSFINMYKKISKIVCDSTENAVYNKFTINRQSEDVLNSLWCADRKNWKDRIWTNAEDLQNRLEKGMVESVSRGVPKDELVKSVKEAYGAEFYRADRIVRTELTHIQNQATADSYKNAGIEEYEFLATDDERTSDECSELNGQRFKFSDAIIGVNFPPIHVNCRCTIVPVIEE